MAGDPGSAVSFDFGGRRFLFRTIRLLTAAIGLNHFNLGKRNEVRIGGPVFPEIRKAYEEAIKSVLRLAGEVYDAGTLADEIVGR